MRYTLLTFGLLTATCAFADAGAPGGSMQTLDADGDRLISLAEAQAGAPDLASRFSKVDADRDGFLSVDEVIAAQPARDVRMVRNMDQDFSTADANADGMLTRAEAEKMPIVSELFGEMDRDADGRVTLDEIREHARKRGPVRVVRELKPGIAKE